MRSVLVAGGTGELGRQVVRELKQRGWRVRVLSRSEERARAAGADEVAVGDALEAASLADACRGVEVVFSSLGQSVGADPGNRGPGYRAVDTVANRNLLASARAAAVARFVYVSVFGADQHRDVAYMGAHADVADEVRRSGLSHAIIQPTGFFSAFRAFFDMARQGRGLVIGDGSARSNPIDDADLAVFCADAVERGDDAVLPVGGPEVLTRRQVVELAFAALGQPPRIMAAPAWAPRAMAPLIRPFAPRLGDLAEFFALVASEDVVAPAYGSRRLAEYYAALAARVSPSGAGQPGS